ncbi:MAG: methyltransferase domain-containing protein [Cytophagaceae bacterium]|nr:methyltransferase domain-containing protein [Gemmatimonadaceae bacterium]
MDPRLQRRVQRYGWDRAADFYEASWAEQLRPAQECLLERAHARPGERVLDVACGTGLVTFALARAVGPAGHVVGTDISEGMIDQATAAAERTDVPVEFHRMDAEQLDFPEAHFDLAVSALGLMYVPHPERAVAEMHRVLGPAGRMVAAVWGARRACGWAEIFPIVERRIASEACPLFFSLGTGDTLADLFIATGLHDVEQVRLTTELAYASDDDAIGAAFRGGPVALAYSRFDDTVREDAHREYLDSIAPYRQDNGYAVPGEFVIVAGRR